MTDLEPGAENQGPTPSLRAASVTLRRGADDARDASAMSFDPANQSLAEALKITYRLLQAGMIVLVLLYLLSGFRSVSEGERGIALLFGKPTATNLQPGFRLTAPYPVGELAKVATGTVETEVNRAFFPYVDVGDEDRAADRLSTRRNLDPGRDGMNITADGNLAHTQWRIVYSRTDPEKFARNIYIDDEGKIVRSAVMGAIVHAIAEVSIDDLLKQSRTDLGSVEQRAQGFAQSTLDALNSGITIQRLNMWRKLPPGALRTQFDYVQGALSAAGKARQDAIAKRRSSLNAVAGEAATVLLDQIDRFEAATEKGDQAAQADILATIDALLEGRPAEIDGVVYERLASGEVTEILNSAVNDRNRLVQEARGDLAMFQAKLAQFEANPLLMVTRDWADAFDEFLGKGYVQTMLVPKGVSAEIWINGDPEIAARIDRQRKETLFRDTADERMQRLRDDRFRTDRGIVNPDARQ